MYGLKSWTGIATAFFCIIYGPYSAFGCTSGSILTSMTLMLIVLLLLIFDGRKELERRRLAKLVSKQSFDLRSVINELPKVKQSHFASDKPCPYGETDYVDQVGGVAFRYHCQHEKHYISEYEDLPETLYESWMKR